MNFSYSSRAMLLAVGVCAALSAAQAAPDAHDFGIEIEKPPASKPKTDKPKTAAPKVTAPKATAPKPASVPQAVEVVSVEAARVPLLLGQMEAGQLTPEAAWKSGALTREGLLFLFERHLDVWKLTEANPHRELYLQLAGLLAPQMSEVAKPSRRVRLWLGEFYRVQQDERAAALLESVLGEFKAPVKSKDPVLFLTTERLAWFYSGAEQHEKAAQTWLRLEELSSDAHWKADGVVEAAREFTAAGNSSKAAELYGRVVAYGDGWLSGMALYDQASALLDQGKHQQARKLLSLPVTGRNAEQIKVALLSKRGYSYYRTGEWELAQKYCNETIVLAAERPLLPGQGLEQRVMQAREVLRLIAHWQNRPLICEPMELAVSVGPEAITKPLALFFTVRALDESPLDVVADDPRLTVRVAPKGVEGDAADYHFVGRNVLVQIAPQLLHQDFETMVRVKSPKFPGFEERVKIRVRTKN